MYQKTSVDLRPEQVVWMYVQQAHRIFGHMANAIRYCKQGIHIYALGKTVELKSTMKKFFQTRLVLTGRLTIRLDELLKGMAYKKFKSRYLENFDVVSGAEYYQACKQLKTDYGFDLGFESHIRHTQKYTSSYYVMLVKKNQLAEAEHEFIRILGQAATKFQKLSIQLKYLIPLISFRIIENDKIQINKEGQVCIQGRQLRLKIQQFINQYNFDYAFTQEQQQFLDLLSNEKWIQYITSISDKILLHSHCDIVNILNELKFDDPKIKIGLLNRFKINNKQSPVYVACPKNKYNEVRQTIKSILKCECEITVKYLHFEDSELKKYLFHAAQNDIISIVIQRDTASCRIKIVSRPKQHLIELIQLTVSTYFSQFNKICIKNLDQSQYRYLQSTEKVIDIEQKYFIKTELIQSTILPEGAKMKTYRQLKFSQYSDRIYYYIIWKGNSRLQNEIHTNIQQILSQVKQISSPQTDSTDKSLPKADQKQQDLSIEKSQIDQQCLGQSSHELCQQPCTQNNQTYELQQTHLDFTSSLIISEQQIIKRSIPLIPRVNNYAAVYIKYAQERGLNIRKESASLKVEGAKSEVVALIAKIRQQNESQFIYPIQWKISQEFELKQVEQSQISAVKALLKIYFKEILRIQNVNARKCWQKKLLDIAQVQQDIAVMFVYVVGNNLIKMMRNQFSNKPESIETYSGLAQAINQLKRTKQKKRAVICHGIIYNKGYIRRQHTIVFSQRQSVIPLYYIQL